MDNSAASVDSQPDIGLRFQVMSLGKSKLLQMLSSTFSTTYLDALSPDSPKRQHIEPPSNNNTTMHSQGVFTLDEVSYHDTPSDCWVIIYDNVYDVTSFLSDHPGGNEVVMEYAGRDATLAFKGVGHSGIAEESLKQYFIGVLVEEERIWSKMKRSSRQT